MQTPSHRIPGRAAIRDRHGGEGDQLTTGHPRVYPHPRLRDEREVPRVHRPAVEVTAGSDGRSSRRVRVIRALLRLARRPRRVHGDHRKGVHGCCVPGNDTLDVHVPLRGRLRGNRGGAGAGESGG